MDRNTLKLVEVKWVDATSFDPWCSIEEVMSEEKHLNEIVSIGYLLKETPEYLLIAQNIDTDSDNCAGCIAIPMSWTIEVEDLCLKKTKKQQSMLALDLRQIENN
jgi:hypothetical protein